MNEFGVPERRSDDDRAVLIECAVALQQSKGQADAIALLLQKGIAPHIIMRVLACAAFRRKRCNHSGNRRDQE